MSYLSLMAAVINLIGWGLYLRGQVKGLVSANPVGWLMSSLIVISSFVVTATVTQNWHIGGMYAAGVIPCLAALGLSLKNKFAPTVKEQGLLGFGGICLVLAFLYPNLSVFAISAYYLMTYWTFGAGVTSGRFVERPLPWVVWTGAAVLQLGAIVMAPAGTDTGMAYVIPLTNLVCWLTIAGLSFRRARLRSQA